MKKGDKLLVIGNRHWPYHHLRINSIVVVKGNIQNGKIPVEGENHLKQPGLSQIINTKDVAPLTKLTKLLYCK